MNASHILGVDIGKEGALALLTADGDLVEVVDMPTLQDGPKGRSTVNGPLLAAIVWRWAPKAAYVELVNARPEEAPVSAFGFGRCRGLVEGVLAAAGVEVEMITSPTWKRTVGIASGQAAPKDASRSEACRRWPAKAEMFARVKDDGRAEAALIGAAGLIRARTAAP